MFAKLAAILSVTLSASTFIRAQASCARTYSVQSGDTCDSIAALQHVSSFQLQFVNTAINADCTNLAVGEQLCLGITGEDCQTTTVVTAGSTCTSIETAASISHDVLLHNNPELNSDCSNLRLNSVLCTSFQEFNYDTSI